MDTKEVIAKLLGKNKKPLSSFILTYDSPQNQLEPIYYWILDFLQDAGWKAEKIIDNFTSSPGSGHFADMNQRASKLQEEGMKILGGLNQVIKSSLNLVYDLKEFRLRLSHYEDSDAKDKDKKEAAMLALKQIWLDNVDLKRGRGSIHQMTAELGYTTLREVFMMANSLDDLKKMNSDEAGIINDQVLRILIPRLSEFLKWKDYSHKELQKRFNIEKSYLKSQVETIKLYSKWIKPYLKSAEQLKQKGFDGNAALVNSFSTSMFELTLFATKSIKSEKKQLKEYKLKREYFACNLISMKFRGHVMQKVTQRGDYGFGIGGRLDMTFDSYAFNEDEITLIKKEIEKQDLDDVLNFDSDMAGDALKELKEDLDDFLNDKEKEKKKEEEKKKDDDINPFSALFSLFSPEKKEEKKKDEIKTIKDIKKDDFAEGLIRKEAETSAIDFLFGIYDVYKKVHGMPTPSSGAFDNNKIK